ncbi:hypothetical protein CspHIS471_0301850 [Cutaneotrichosporon sp. HIS471]|nr:hypothetical protein CspHIS471_0301850 [Cutaneotrichosporon sp. HIS471]
MKFTVITLFTLATAFVVPKSALENGQHNSPAMDHNPNIASEKREEFNVIQPRACIPSGCKCAVPSPRFFCGLGDGNCTLATVYECGPGAEFACEYGPVRDCWNCDTIRPAGCFWF